MTDHWLVTQVCKLAAELTDHIDGDADRVEVELRVICKNAEPGAPVIDVTEHIRRSTARNGDWGGTERLSREHFAW